MSHYEEDIQFLKKEIQELKDNLQEIKKILHDINEYVKVKKQEIPKCSSCDCSYTKYCACGCGEKACECLFVNWGYEYPDGLYFYTLNCAEQLKNDCHTSTYLKEELEYFVKTWKAQNE